jgi:DNA-binding response OmpR family regulator
MTKRILIIDDESNFCDVLKDVLEEEGYAVDAPLQLASAIGIALLGNHDLIILDLRMPGMDGFEIARLFKQQKLMTPILIISGYITDDMPTELDKLGIQHRLSKPSGVSQLRRAVATAIA